MNNHETIAEFRARLQGRTLTTAASATLRRPSWQGFDCGDQVNDKADPRHVGRVEALINGWTANVRWENGWLSTVEITDLRKAK